MKTLFTSKNRALVVLGILICGLLVANLVSTSSLEAQLGTVRTVETLKLIARDSARVNGPLTLNNVIDGTTQIAGVDTFTTTAAADTIVLSGITANDIFSIQERTTTAADAIDTVFYSYRTAVDTLFVTRYAAAATSGTLKGGGKYAYIRIK